MNQKNKKQKEEDQFLKDLTYAIGERARLKETLNKIESEINKDERTPTQRDH